MSEHCFACVYINSGVLRILPSVAGLHSGICNFVVRTMAAFEEYRGLGGGPNAPALKQWSSSRSSASSLDDSVLLVRRTPVSKSGLAKLGNGLRYNGAKVVVELRGQSLIVGNDVFALEDTVVEMGRKRDLKVRQLDGDLVSKLQFETDVERDSWFNALSIPTDKISLADFEVITAIGKGGMGSVFLVKHKESGEKLAMKVLPRHVVEESNKSMRRALDERLVLEMLTDQPFIIQLKFAFQTSKNLYMVSEFCAGGDLHDYLQAHNFNISETTVKHFMTEVVVAVSKVHEIGAIYRDLKPENILISSSGHVKLADFGLAKLVTDQQSTRSYSFCGTKKFMAPEVFFRRGHGFAADLWSLGALLYTLLTGSTPYTDPGNVEVSTLSYPSNVSESARNLVAALLAPESERLSMAQVKNHRWFSNVNWKRVVDEVDEPVKELWEEWEETLLTSGKFLHTKVERVSGLTLGDEDRKACKAPAPIRRFFKCGSKVNLIPGYLYSSSSIRSSSDSM